VNSPLPKVYPAGRNPAPAISRPSETSPVVVANIPDELKHGVRHVCWRHEEETKRPKIPGTLRNASSADPETWRSFARCVAMFEKRPDLHDGIGRMFAKDDEAAGVDFDDCRDPETGQLSERAAQIIQMLDSYAEVSPSKTGVKVWIRAVLPAGRRRKPGLEIYDRGRFFTLTGWHLESTPRAVAPRQDEIEALIREEFPEPGRKAREPYAGLLGARIELVEFLQSAGVEVLREIRDQTAEVVFAVVCPWAHEHTGQDRSGTRAGQYSDGALWFRCEHAHCARRGWEQFRDYLSPPARFLRRRSRARRAAREVR
jgi:hypothetical protein